jgi:hypothetical protein
VLAVFVKAHGWILPTGSWEPSVFPIEVELTSWIAVATVPL